MFLIGMAMPEDVPRASCPCPSMAKMAMARRGVTSREGNQHADTNQHH